jgi:hypothetical protein
VTGDCWAQLRRARKRGLAALVVAAPLILATQIWSQAFGLRALLSFVCRPPARSAGLMTIAPPEVTLMGAPLPPPPEQPSQPLRTLGGIAPRPLPKRGH